LSITVTLSQSQVEKILTIIEESERCLLAREIGEVISPLKDEINKKLSEIFRL
jgi:hypothetical protein